MTNTPYGEWKSADRTLRVSLKMFQDYKEMELEESIHGVAGAPALERIRETFIRAFGPGEVKLVVDPTVDGACKHSWETDPHGDVICEKCHTLKSETKDE